MAALLFRADTLHELPAEPGVYLFLGQKSEVLYVGKAVDLRARVRQYLRETSERRPVAMALSRHVQAVDTIVTTSEKEALLLENSLIKRHAPRFNVRLRDDKTYFSLRLDASQEFPRITVVWRRRKDDAYYFGPYTSAWSCRQTLQALNTLFPLRTCTDAVLRNRARPCIMYEIKRCVAPCVGYVAPADYGKIVDDAVRFLKGRDRGLLERLEAEMRDLSTRMEYERAAHVRDKIRAVETTLGEPMFKKGGEKERDAIGVFDAGNEVEIAVVSVRGGVLANATPFVLDASLHERSALLASFLGQYYGPARIPPPEILLPEPCSDEELLEDMLSDLRGARVAIETPERGEKKHLLELAMKNAELTWRQRHDEEDRTRTMLGRLQEALGLRRRPERIECFDISNTGGGQVVGSLAAFTGGKKDPGRYRRYRIRSVEGQDDFASMAEVLRRRLVRGKEEDDLPDLVVIDGGKGQLSAVYDVMRDLSVDLDVVGLAKARSGGRARSTLSRSERIVKPDAPFPIVLEQSSPENRLLMRIRDEAHRFAISYHRKLREKASTSSVLESVPGLGPKRVRALLRRFGSLEGIRKADDAEIAGVKGLSPKLIEALRGALQAETGAG